jgi:hypothetical protein
VRLKPDQRVTYEVAKRRALACLDTKEPTRTAEVGRNIWPDNNMHAQGLGAAASRILSRMCKEGLAQWVPYPVGKPDRKAWGWIKNRRQTTEEPKP